MQTKTTSIYIPSRFGVRPLNTMVNGGDASTKVPPNDRLWYSDAQPITWHDVVANASTKGCLTQRQTAVTDAKADRYPTRRQTVVWCKLQGYPIPNGRLVADANPVSNGMLKLLTQKEKRYPIWWQDCGCWCKHEDTVPNSRLVITDARTRKPYTTTHCTMMQAQS